MYLLGVDCATTSQNTGLALGELRGGNLKLLEVATGRSRSPVGIAAEWVARHEVSIIALDAPLGWPLAMHSALAHHEAGMLILDEPDHLFSRATDREIRRRLGKRPLEVGADRIARTALAALGFLRELRDRTNQLIPLAWDFQEDVSLRAIEVYPAATRIGHGAPGGAGSLKGLETRLDWVNVAQIIELSEHARDAAVCVLAAADFVKGRAVPPDDLQIARIEGWIWAPDARR